MKKILATLLMLFGTVVSAQHYHGYHHHHRHAPGSHAWVAPLIIGGVVGYALSRPAQTAPPPTVIYVPGGYPPPPLGYRYEQILDGNCNCYRWVLVQG